MAGDVPGFAAEGHGGMRTDEGALCHSAASNQTPATRRPASFASHIPRQM